MRSKKEKIMELFFSESGRHWHFEEILAKAGISRPQAMNWLKRLANKGIIKRVKERKRMPYYTGNFECPAYKNLKKIYALNKFYKTGFLNHLMSLPKAETIILFGSFARADWYKESDIDLFILGEAGEFDREKYEKKLGTEIQTFICRNETELKKFSPGLLRNILRGNIIKGYVPKEVFANAGI